MNLLVQPRLLRYGSSACYTLANGLLLSLALPPDERRFPGPEISREGAVISGRDDQWSPGACVVFAYWLIFLAFSITVLWCHWVVRLYVVAMTFFFIYRGRESQGLAEWLAELAGVPLTPDTTHSTD